MDAKGRRTAVQIDLRANGAFWEDILDVAMRVSALRNRRRVSTPFAAACKGRQTQTQCVSSGPVRPRSSKGTERLDGTVVERVFARIETLVTEPRPVGARSCRVPSISGACASATIGSSIASTMPSASWRFAPCVTEVPPTNKVVSNKRLQQPADQRWARFARSISFGCS